MIFSLDGEYLYNFFTVLCPELHYLKEEKMAKDIGLIGLGKMGYRIAERLVDHEYRVVATDTSSEPISQISDYGAVGKGSIEDLVKEMKSPRFIILSVPAGDITEEVISNLTPHLSPNDIVADSGNSFFEDSQRRARMLKKNGIYLLDVGISGGVDGARNGACLMIGGEREVYERVEHVFAALAQNGSYSYLGRNGAGHLVKGFHNLVEYGYLQALAEGLATISALSEQKGLGIGSTDVCDIWNKGSIIQSRLVGDARKALASDETLAGVSGSVIGQTISEMEQLVIIAQELGISVPSCGAAIRARIDSLDNPTRVGQITNATRRIFGGHEEWKE